MMKRKSFVFVLILLGFVALPGLDCPGTVPNPGGSANPGGDVDDNCPNDPNKTEPGVCGCGTPDTDRDSDGTADCNDNCPDDPSKTEPGVCGCGAPDTDSDGDGTPDCNDNCPDDTSKTDSGLCGCGTPDTDSDGDGTPDCNDECPSDPNKTSPGNCGCGEPDTPGCVDGFVYWAIPTNESSIIYRARLDGSGVEEIFAIHNDVHPDAINDLLIDKTQQKLYFSAYHPSLTGRLMRVNLDGSNVELLLSGEAQGLYELALDPIGGKIYWASSDYIKRCNRDGSAVETIVTGLADAHGIAVDFIRERVYWMDPPLFQSAHLSGMDIVTYLEAPHIIPSGLALDISNQVLYWGEAGRPYVIRRVNTRGTSLEIVVTDMYSSDIALDVPRHKMYWCGRKESTGVKGVWRSNLSGTNVELVVSNGRPNTIAVIVDVTN